MDIEKIGVLERIDYLAIILLFLVPFPFVSTNCLASFSVKFMNITENGVMNAYAKFISDFRVRQFISAALTIILFGVAWLIAYFYSGLNISHISWISIGSTMLVSHAVFDQLSWYTTWGGKSLIDVMNRWYFRIIYSIGVILLLMALMQ